MAFVLDSIHKLVFEDFSGENGECLEIRVKPLTFEEWVRLEAGGFTPEQAVDLFTAHLVSWNLSNRGEDGTEVEVPATSEGLHSQDATFVLQLAKLWAQSLSTVSRPLGSRSTSGDQYPEGSIPMEPLSESPESSSSPS